MDVGRHASCVSAGGRSFECLIGGACEPPERLQPLPVIVRLEALPLVHAALLAGERKLRPVLQSVATQCGDGSGLLLVDVETFGLPAGGSRNLLSELEYP